LVYDYSIEDILARLYSNEKIGAVSCRCKVLNLKGFWARMQDVEYAIIAFIQGSYNWSSAVSLWGSCMAFKKEAWVDIKGLRENFIIEDMNAACELQEHGWKVEQSSSPCYTIVPNNFKEWKKQKLRWGSGLIQCILSHMKFILKIL